MLNVRPAPVEWRTGSITTTGITPSQGDKSIGHTKDGRTYMREQGGNEIKAFRRQVRDLMQARYPGLSKLEPIFPKGCPVAIRVTLKMPLLKDQEANWRGEGQLIWHCVAKDADKMFRAVGDALTEAHLWADDGQACDVRIIKVRHPMVGCSIEWRSLA